MVSTPIEEVTPTKRKLADDMFETMYDAPGIGLRRSRSAAGAADRHGPRQEGRGRRSQAASRASLSTRRSSASRGPPVYEEGRLSIPEYYEEVERPAKVRVRFPDPDGKVHEEDAEGLYATCIQHEIDH